MNVQSFTANGTWTKPSGAGWVTGILIGQGGGGGSGRKGSGDAYGGGGGAPGAVVVFRVPADMLGATQAVVVGNAANGGASQTSVATNGNNGTDGVATTFAMFKAVGGAKGSGGTNAAGAAGALSAKANFVLDQCSPFRIGSTSATTTNVQWDTGAGGAGQGGTGSTPTALPVAATDGIGPTGGGGGGGNTGGAASGGAGGGYGTYSAITTVAGGTAGGFGGAGGNGNSFVGLPIGTGGGGGGCNGNSGGRGGNGANYGGGGGGGAASDNSNNSGAGGDGGGGYAIIITEDDATTGTVNANVTQISGDTTAADNAESFFDGTGYAGTNNVIPTVGTVTGGATAVNQSRILDRIDYQRGHHTVAGQTFYVDGVSGSDANAGTRAAPKKTISGALAVCTSNVHDEIILLPNSAGGPTTITESATISITKNYVQIRGPGRDVLVTQTAGANRDVFSITANGVELSGFRIATNGATSNGVTVSGGAEFVRLHRLWIESVTQDAVQFNVANRCEVNHCTIVAAGRDGVRVSSGAGTGTYNLVLDSVIRNCVGSGVNLQGSDASECRIQRNMFRDNATAITVGSGAVDTVITDNRFAGNTTNISDSGTGTAQSWNYLGTVESGAVTLVTTTTNVTNDPLVSTSGTATAGGASSITLQANAVSGTDYYKDQAVMLTGGTGAGQTNRITAQAGLVCTVQTPWVTQPDNTTTYRVLGRVE